MKRKPSLPRVQSCGRGFKLDPSTVCLHLVLRSGETVLIAAGRHGEGVIFAQDGLLTTDPGKIGNAVLHWLKDYTQAVQGE